jgi:hypothetical protein
MKKVYRNVTIDGDHIAGEYTYEAKLAGDFAMFGDTVQREPWTRFSAVKNLFRIQLAISRSDEAFERIWATQDGYGVAGFTPVQDYDWSGIRDSSDEAVEAMDTIAKEYVTDADLAEVLGVEAV